MHPIPSSMAILSNTRPGAQLQHYSPPSRTMLPPLASLTDLGHPTKSAMPFDGYARDTPRTNPLPRSESESALTNSIAPKANGSADHSHLACGVLHKHPTMLSREHELGSRLPQDELHDASNHSVHRNPRPGFQSMPYDRSMRVSDRREQSYAVHAVPLPPRANSRYLDLESYDLQNFAYRPKVHLGEPIIHSRGDVRSHWMMDTSPYRDYPAPLPELRWQGIRETRISPSADGYDPAYAHANHGMGFHSRAPGADARAPSPRYLDSKYGEFRSPSGYGHHSYPPFRRSDYGHDPVNESRSAPPAHPQRTERMQSLSPQQMYSDSSPTVDAKRRLSVSESPGSPVRPAAVKFTKTGKTGGRSKHSGNHVCQGCQATTTPEWRKGPTGPRTLCNACGLLYAKMCRKREQDAVAAAIACNRDPALARKEVADELLKEDRREEILESLRAGVRVVASVKQHRMGANLSAKHAQDILDPTKASST